MKKNLILATLLLNMQLFSVDSNAALFDDTEARKKILELEGVMQSENQASKASIDDLKKSQKAIEQRLVGVEAITKGPGLMDMQNQLEVLKQDMAKLQGALELANHNVEATQQRQKDLYGDIDTRLRKLEATAATAIPSPTPATAPADSASLTPATVPALTNNKNTQEYQLLELANGLSKASKYKDAFNAYDKFLKDYPSSSSAAEAIYGLGYSQFALKNYKSAIITHQKLLDLYPESALVPDAMLNMANSQIQLGLVPNAKKTLHDLIVKFPSSEVTSTAQKRLKALEAIK